MFGKLLESLTGGSPDPLPEIDAQQALAALMVRIARADDHYADAEKRRIETTLARHFSLNDAAAADLRQTAEALETEAVDTIQFTQAIKASVPIEDRNALVSTLWEVALADGERDAEEDAFLRMLVSLLGVSDKDNAFARQKAKSRQ